MNRSELELLVVPDSGEALQIAPGAKPTDGTEVDAATLASASGRTFEVREGIPSFVAKETLDEQTVRSFGEKWEKHRYYRDHTRAFYTSWYVARFGFGDAAGLAKFLADKRYVLDAGTGAGRDAQNFTDAAPESVVFGVDTSWHALATNAANARERGAKPGRLVHADLHHLPFPDGFFDFVNCDQVIHHTPDPRAAFEALTKKLRVGGEVATYVYRKKSVIREFTDDFVRDRIKAGSFEEALAVTEGITKLGKAFAELNQRVTIEEDIPVLGITKGDYDVQRFLHWHVLKCFWNADFDFFTNNVVNADWYHPVHCHRFTPEEFRAWFDESAWDVQAWDEQEAGISCRARKR